jgi:transposase
MAKGPGGRPTDYRPEYCQKLIDFCSLGRSYEAFAGFLGVSKQTLYTWEKKHPEFLDAKRIARAKAQLTLEGWGEDLMKGNFGKGASASVWIFMMKNMTGWRDSPAQDDDDAIDGLEFLTDDT